MKNNQDRDEYLASVALGVFGAALYVLLIVTG